jgi:hypothetical protein
MVMHEVMKTLLWGVGVGLKSFLHVSMQQGYILNGASFPPML